MKKQNKFLGMTAVALATLGLVSCQNEFDSYINSGNNNSGEVSLVKAPEVIAWSGNQLLGSNGINTVSAVSTRAADIDWHNYMKCMDYNSVNWDEMDTSVNAYYPYKDNAPSTSDRGESVSTAEYNYVMEYLRNHPNEGSTQVDLSNYFIQNVGSSYATYDVDFIAENGSVHHSSTITGGNQMDYLVINGYHMGDYNASYGPRALVLNTPLQPEISYHDSWGTEDNTKTDKYRFYYIPNADGNGYSLYLCFDYAVKKYDNAQLDFQGDGIYNDWVIKIVPADGSEIVPPTETPSNPETPETPGNGDDNNGDNNITDENRHGNEVEVNYAILDSHDQYDVADLVTKLSIHVRKATDVTIVVPIPGKYFVESDDLYIFTDHADFVYNDQVNTVSYEIAGKTVTLTVVIGENDITVSTSGIDQDVIDACWEANKDGINFEVYNYFQTADAYWEPDKADMTVVAKDVNREELFEAMNLATITFTSNPDYYINAFGANDDKTARHDWHATVRPSSTYFSLIYEQTTHLNGTPYNDIYLRSGAQVDDYHKH